MFGSKLKKANTAALQALRPLIANMQRNQGLAPDFWTDPYVLGYFGFAVAHHAKLATHGQISPTDLGIVLADVFGALSNMNGEAIRRRYIELIDKDGADFKRANDDAAALFLYQIGALKDEADHPLVRTASRLAGGSQDRERVAAMICVVSFVRECEKRFKISN